MPKREIETQMICASGLIKAAQPDNFFEFCLGGPITSKDREPPIRLVPNNTSDPSDNVSIIITIECGPEDFWNHLNYKKYRLIVTRAPVGKNPNLLWQESFLWSGEQRNVAVYVMGPLSKRELRDQWRQSGVYEIYCYARKDERRAKRAKREGELDPENRDTNPFLEAYGGLPSMLSITPTLLAH